MSEPQNVVVIPARGGSVRVPRKNIRDFFGHPMLSWTIGLAKRLTDFDRIIVSTDDDEIEAIAKGCGAEVFRREKDDGARGTQEVAREVLVTLENIAYACVIYPTAGPFIHKSDIEWAHRMAALRPCDYVVAVGVEPLRDIGYFYLGHAYQFREKRPLWNTVTGIYVIPEWRAIDINTEQDWSLAEVIYETNKDGHVEH